MSGPPHQHHPHNRPMSAANPPWNHLQVPNYFPRQPQVAHMSNNEHSILHQHQQPTWHTPTPSTPEPPAIIKQLPSSQQQHSPHIFGLSTTGEQNCTSSGNTGAGGVLLPGVDLSVTRNGNNQNGDVQTTTAPPTTTTPISLSVRDANKINSLPASVLQDIQGIELPKQPCSNSNSPVGGVVSLVKSDSAKNLLPKRSNVRVDSILERLNPSPVHDKPDKQVAPHAVTNQTPSSVSSVIVATNAPPDDNSNSSSGTILLNVPTVLRGADEDTASSCYNSNEDSLDSGLKSRRKRKQPSKTVVRVSKDEDDNIVEETVKRLAPERRRSLDDDLVPAVKTRRKTSSESETIDNIAAMVQEGLNDCGGQEKRKLEGGGEIKEEPGKKEEEQREKETKLEDSSVPVEAAPSVTPPSKPVTVSVIRTNDTIPETMKNEEPNKAASPPNFVEVENKLEEMFAGIEDANSCEAGKNPVETKLLDDDDVLMKLEDSTVASTSGVQVQVTSTSELHPKQPKKKKSTTPKKRNSSTDVVLTLEGSASPKRKRKKTGKKPSGGKPVVLGKVKNKKSVNGQQTANASVLTRDVYAYDSGSNASSSRSRGGPFIQIRGPRDSPISVIVVNTPNTTEDDHQSKTKKFHDDSEYRHKVRSKGLHCSTLSNKYDAQTKDASWICAFCKRGPHHATELSAAVGGGYVPAGDLFGPYFITTQCVEFERMLSDPYDKQFKSKKVRRVLEEADASKLSGKKSKRKPSEIPLDRASIDFLGITETVSNNKRGFEVWAHEDCIVWSPGVYLVGPKIVGLEEAIWTSCNVTCRLCVGKGANICCLKRGCVSIVHLCCAKAANWQFDEDNFKAYCPQHKLPNV